MFSDKKSILTLTAVVFGAVVLYVGLNNIGVVLNAAGVVLNWFGPLIIGAALAFFLNVFVYSIENRIFKKFKGKKWLRAVSIILTILVILLVLTLLSVFIFPELKRTVLLLADVIPSYVNDLIERTDAIELPFKNMSLGDIFQLDQFKDITGLITQKSVEVAGNALNLTTAFAGSVFNGILSFIIAVYILCYKEKIGAVAVRTIKAFLPENAAKTVLDISKLSYTVFFNFITGQLTEAVILGTLCYICMSLFRFPYAAAISMLVGVTALIPIIGAFIGIAVGAFLIVMVKPLKALLFIIFMLILQQVEGNLIYPKVVGKSVGLPDILVIISVLVGGRIGGLAAVLLSVPVCSIIYSIFKTQLEKREQKQQ